MINIIRTSIFADRLLADANSLRVHSVYEKTINLMTPTGLLLALQAKGSPLSPVSLITDMTAAEIRKLPYSSPMYMTNYRSRMAGLPSNIVTTLSAADIDIKKAELVDLSMLSLLNTFNSLSPYTRESANYHIHCKKILYAVQKIIAGSDTNGFENIIKNTPAAIEKRNDSLILTAAHKKLTSITIENLPHSLQEFIGLGTGLTPSGDDFVCGALAALQFLHMDICENSIKSCIKYTNTISQVFLSCALQRQYSEAVIQLFNNPGDIDRHSRAFHAIGHSSGIDTICGIYFILHMFL